MPTLPKRLYLKWGHTDEYVEALKGQFLYEIPGKHYDHFVARDMNVYMPDGSLLLALRRNVISPDVCVRAFQSIPSAARVTNNRGTASGSERFRKQRQDGTPSEWLYANPVESGIVGYFDKPYCRTTAFTRDQVTKWNGFLPYIEAVNQVFARVLPDRYAAQIEAVRNTPSKYVIPGTAFTTVTINRNWSTAVHTDEGDLAEGFGVMSMLRAGLFFGGQLVFPKWRVAVHLRTGDVLLANVHEYHGNMKILGIPPYDRISMVFYFRSNMRNCPGERA